MIYLDNAATTGTKPKPVIKAVNQALEFYSSNPGRSGHRLSQKTAESIYRIRKLTADFFDASGAEKVVFTSGCTESINCVLKGVIKKEDHVIVSDLEHNAVIRPLVKIGADYSTAAVSLTDDSKTVENIKKLIKQNTKLIFVTAASNVLGKRLPLERIGKLCKEKNILFGVDAAQGAGVFPVSMKKCGIDFLCAAPHKGLYAPMGVGILIAEKEIENTLKEGGTGVESISLYQPQSMPERLEAGTLNVPGIFGTGAGIEFVKSKGIDNIFSHEIRLLQRVYENLSGMEDIILYTPYPQKNSFAPVLPFNIKNKTSSETAMLLDRYSIAVRAGLHCAPSAHKVMGTIENGAVRICPSVFNSATDIAEFIKAIKKVKNL